MEREINRERGRVKEIEGWSVIERERKSHGGRVI